MDMHPMWIQGIGLCGTALYLLSFQMRENRKLFFVQLLSYAFYIAHLCLLHAASGAASYAVNFLRSLFLCGKGDFGKGKRACVFLCALQLMTLPLTWNGWISFLPVMANIASTVAGYSGNAHTIRRANLCINSPLWIVYSFLVGSWAGILDEGLSMVSMGISLLRLGKDGKDTK